MYSANLLSQLPLPVTERADGAKGAGRAIVEGHLADLAAFRCRVCLITDVAYSEIGPGGIAGGTVDLLEGVALPAPDRSWDWDVSPRGEEDPLMAYRHHVRAFRDLAASWRKPPGVPAA